ncbi:MAG: integrin alpha, partial [Burkholderiaceae bacterium]|nr:integrin alpha [Burkholderiaceae bacterium]
AGWSVAGAGDINKDGYDDLIVGAPYGDDGGGNAGEAYVILGNANFGQGNQEPMVYVSDYEDFFSPLPPAAASEIPIAASANSDTGLPAADEAVTPEVICCGAAGMDVAALLLEQSMQVQQAV